GNRLPGGRVADSSRCGSLLGVLLKRVTLLVPRVAVVMIAPHFPKTPPLISAKFEGPHPFCALPSVEFRHHQPERPAMVGFEIFSVMPIREQNVVVQKFSQRQIGRVTAVAMDENEASLRLKRH